MTPGGGVLFEPMHAEVCLAWWAWWPRMNHTVTPRLP